MTSPWPVVRLGCAIRHRKQFITLDDLAQYRRCRVRLHAEGIVLRDVMLGSEIRTKQQQVCRAGEFLVAEIDAKVGGFGIVPDELDGAIVSSHYFLFEIDQQALAPKFLSYYLRTPAFQDQVAAQGSTNYAAIRPQHVLEYAIPLPSIPEQRRIVARIEQLATKIAEVHMLRREADTAADALVVHATAVLDDPRWPRSSIDDLVGRSSLKNGLSVKSSDVGTGVRCLTLSSVREGKIDCSQSKPVPLSEGEAQSYLVQPGDVFIVRGNGAKHLVGRAGSVDVAQPLTIFPDLLIRVPLHESPLLPDFFVAAWNSPRSRTAIEEAAKTTSGIWKINQGHISAMTVPVPPVPEQERLLAQLGRASAQISQLKSVQTQVATDVDALLPSILDRAFKGEL